MLYILKYLPRHGNQFDTKDSNCFYYLVISFFYKQYGRGRTGKPHFLVEINLRLSATLIHKFVFARPFYDNNFHISVALVNFLAHFLQEIKNLNNEQALSARMFM